MKRIVLFLMLLSATAAEAQIKQITGGGYQNSNGVACAGCILYLQLPVDATVTGTGQIVPNVNSYQLDANGNVPANSNLWANDQLTPTGLTYKATLTNAGGGRIWGPEFLSITGTSPISLTQLVPVASSSVFLGNPAVLNVANTFTANQTINANLTVSGTETFTGPFSSTATTNINNTLYVSQFAGADLGAKMNAAVTNCTVTLALPACKYIIDVAGTISTTPNFPQGSTVEFYPLLYTLATTFPINHSNTQFQFDGSRFNYNQDTGNAAFLVGKNATGTVNTQNGATGGCSANCVTFATGTNFANIDAGDKLIIANATFNVASVQSTTVLTVTSAPGTQNGAAYAAQLNPTSSGFPSVTLRDLTIGYTGAGTNATNTAFLVQNVTTAHFDNFYINGYSNGYGVRCLGSVEGIFIDIRQTSNKNAIVLDRFVGGGSTIPSNGNLFIHPQILSSPAGGNPILVTNNSVNNIIQFGDFEGNAATVMGTVNLGAQAQVLWSDHERNGDGTASSADWVVSSPASIFFGNTFTSAAVNTPNTGISAIAGAAAIRIDSNRWGTVTPYANAWTFAGGITGALINNSGVIGFAGHTDPVGLVINENGGFGIAVTTGAAIGDTPSIPNGNCLRGAVAINNSTFCLIGPSSGNGVALDPGGNGTTTTGALTVGANGNQGLKFGGITNSTGLQAFNTTTTCTTAATINTPCTTAAITLPVGYSDTNYRVFCQGLGVTGFPQLQTVTKSNTTFTITINNLTAAAASYSSFDCMAGHN